MSTILRPGDRVVHTQGDPDVRGTVLSTFVTPAHRGSVLCALIEWDTAEPPRQFKSRHAVAMLAKVDP